ncbi:MAG: spermidine/putrescine transport system ATP-binding protein/putrescine transport system ATP-binding protein [Candidatus Kentron sp. G]|nr:MAG: spermidine/putrescine transport system ATP-binding protein/putrescine transport system ATP-binding protein [Candidatus Kentron sp. G]VFM99770.1 MAG: spermidine/putrescine transport system ATP-binding protein/putrescine transport system ATP-binding protein [Candidatus Kentron sp. G]VFN01007.1 MAG: spermidine/putrescine transport system ATP-binding protein/putrescine transport system ATP-binding protein [Candidatus Kentron sp. G]
MSNPSFIRVENVSRHFGPTRAVDRISLAIDRGEFFGLLGPSGCGKTTLLRMLAGFESPDSGEIHIDGQPMSGVAPYVRPVNMVFQNYAIFPHLNVARNIAFGLRKDRLPRDEVSRRVDEALELIKLAGYGSRDPRGLSGGERQRVALARALIKKPKVLLLDEPLGALDKKLREQMQMELRDLQRSIGITFVFVTHDQDEALTMSDRIAVMSRGRVIEVGSPAALYEQPGTRFVADFLGNMNFFRGRVRETRNGLAMVDTGRLGPVRVLVRDSNITKGDNVTVAIRPENIVIGDIISGTSSTNGIGGVSDSMTNSVSGSMVDAAYFGHRAHIYVRVEESHEPVLVTMQNLDGAASITTHGQKPVTLCWSEKSMLLLGSD